MRLTDDSGSIYVTYVGDAGEKIFGITCSDMVKLSEENEMLFKSKLKGCYFKEFSVVLKAYSDVYNGETRVKYMIQRIFPLQDDNNYLGGVNCLLEMLEFK